MIRFRSSQQSKAIKFQNARYTAIRHFENHIVYYVVIYNTHSQVHHAYTLTYLRKISETSWAPEFRPIREAILQYEDSLTR